MAETGGFCFLPLDYLSVAVVTLGPLATFSPADQYLLNLMHSFAFRAIFSIHILTSATLSSLGIGPMAAVWEATHNLSSTFTAGSSEAHAKS